jgi:hypothetical protein
LVFSFFFFEFVALSSTTRCDTGSDHGGYMM